MTAQPRCSVIVPVHGHAGLTRQCLDALLERPPRGASVEVVVVDDASTDDTAALLASYGERVRIVTRAVNGGFARAVNDGAEAADGELLVFLNNDTIPEPGWLDALVEHADGHPRAGAIGSRLLFPDGTVQHAGVIVCRDPGLRHVYAGFPGEHPAVMRSRRCQIVTAACMLVRRPAFDEAGGFDTTFVNGLEDADLCLRLGELGWEVRYCAGSVVWHLETASRQARFDRWNSIAFADRWYERMRSDDLETYADDGLLELRHALLYPATLRVDPRLAAVEQEGRLAELEGLLAEQRARIEALQRENAAVRVAALEADAAQVAPEAAPLRAAASLSEAVVRDPSGAGGPALVSVVAVADGRAGWVRGLAARIEGQNLAHRLELVVAVPDERHPALAGLAAAGAGVVAVGAASFGEALALAAMQARGDVVVVVHEGYLPANADWLRNVADPLLGPDPPAAVASRVLPAEEQDPVDEREAALDPVAGAAAAEGPGAPFHLLGTGLRREALERVPLAPGPEPLAAARWARAARADGMILRFNPVPILVRRERPSGSERLKRALDEGRAAREAGVPPPAPSVLGPELLAAVIDDWRALRERGVEGPGSDRLLARAAVERAIERLGRHLGAGGGMRRD